MKLSTLASIMWFLSLAAAAVTDGPARLFMVVNGFAWIVAMIAYKDPPEDC